MPGTTHLIKWVGGCSPEWVILKLYQGGGLHGTNHAHTCYYEFPLSYYDTQIVAYGHVLRMLDIQKYSKSVHWPIAILDMVQIYL